MTHLAKKILGQVAFLGESHAVTDGGDKGGLDHQPDARDLGQSPASIILGSDGDDLTIRRVDTPAAVYFNRGLPSRAG
jgi:hypothetical protein